MKLFRRYKYAVTLIAFTLLCYNANSVSTMMTDSITLSGTASGGEITLVDLSWYDAKYITTTTLAGESASSVAAKLAAGIIATDPFKWKGPNTFMIDETFGISAEGGSLRGLSGMLISGSEFVGYFNYALAGTESGLGIPQPPKHVTALYNPTSKTISVHWENPPNNYDNISVKFMGKWGIHARIPGNATSFEIDAVKHKLDITNEYIRVVGYNGSTPSNAGAIRLKWTANPQYHTLSEAFNLPFSRGVLPNWEAWSNGVTSETVLFEQVMKDDWQNKNAPSNPVEYPEAKSLYQKITPLTSDTVCGVFRKFIGLEPGRIYRATVRVNTLELSSMNEPWQFSLHMAYNSADGDDLTTAQLCGLAPLPDGSSGPTAGQFALYDNDATTSGTWERRSTDHAGSGFIMRNITLPEGFDTITVWLRHSGADSTGVGLDWISLQDNPLR